MYFTLILTGALLITVLPALIIAYQKAAFREPQTKKPSFDFFPKYKKKIRTRKSIQELEAELKQYGFNKIAQQKNMHYFNRGSLLGDFSVKLIKLKLILKILSKEEIELSLSAAGVIAFDTGDLWTFFDELYEKLALSN